MGREIIITVDGNGYIGKAGGETIFTAQLNGQTGAFRYTQFASIDHPGRGQTGVDDIICLRLGVTVEDSDGDTDTAFMNIDILDAGPVAKDDTVMTDESEISGNLLDNDTICADHPVKITQIKIDGKVFNIGAGQPTVIETDHGVLTISQNGDYRYTGQSNGMDQFKYTVTDFDGDSDTAIFKVTVKDIDNDPVDPPIIVDEDATVDESILCKKNLVVKDGVINLDLGGDKLDKTSGNGDFTSEGARSGNMLSSGGKPVDVKFNPDTNAYTGSVGNLTIFVMTINMDASYTFKLFQPLDHGDVNADNESIFLNFGVDVLDDAGDEGEGFVTIAVRDDAPNARDDYFATSDKTGTTRSEAKGVVITNDDRSADINNFVSSVGFEGRNINVPESGEKVTIDGRFGSLTISKFGSFTYVTKQNVEGDDVFTYSLHDSDGDTDTAQLTIRNGEVSENVIHVNEARTYSGTDEADLFILNAIQNAAPSLNNVEIGQDCIDLSKLLDSNDDVTNAIEDFVFIQDSENGRDTLVFVDADGQGGEEAKLAVRLNGTNDNTLEDLIENHTIIV